MCSGFEAGSYLRLIDFVHHSALGQSRGSPGANLKSISHRCYLRRVALEWELTKETI